MKNCLFFFWLIEYVCQMTFAAVLTIKMVCHEYASAAALIWTLSSQSGDFTVFVYFVIFQYSQLDLLLLVLNFLWSCVVLLLALTTTTTKAQHEMKGWFFLNIIIRQCSAVFQLFAGKDQTLLIRWDTFFILDFCFYIFNGVTRFDLVKKLKNYNNNNKIKLSIKIKSTSRVMVFPVKVLTKICI